MNLRRVELPEEKSGICNAVLRALPDWFGNESAIIGYVREVQSLPFWAAFDGERPIGFVALKKHNAFTFEVCVMGVLDQYHRHGIGRSLLSLCEAYCVDDNAEYLTVKTLDESRPDDGYAKTRQFYLAMGFRPLEVFKLLWDEDNPCLFMAKRIAKVRR